MTNEIKVTGVVGSDPELRYTDSGVAVTSFRIADSTNRFNQDTKSWEQVGETIWWNVSVWDSKAEAVQAQITKGTRVVVEGKVNFRKFAKKDGTEGLSQDIRATEVSVPVSGKGNGGAARSAAPAQANVPTAVADDDSPF